MKRRTGRIIGGRPSLTSTLHSSQLMPSHRRPGYRRPCSLRRNRCAHSPTTVGLCSPPYAGCHRARRAVTLEDGADTNTTGGSIQRSRASQRQICASPPKAASGTTSWGVVTSVAAPGEAPRAPQHQGGRLYGGLCWPR